MSNYYMTSGSDGNMWFSETIANKIGKVTPSGNIEEFEIPTSNSFPADIVAGSDGNIWFIERGSNKIGKITTEGVINEFFVGHGLENLILGPDGNIWYIGFIARPLNNDYFIGYMSSDGNITEFPRGESGLNDLEAGSDGKIWFTESLTNKIGNITTDGTVAEYVIPTANSNPKFITKASDNTVWFAEIASNKIGKVSLDGSITEFESPFPASSIADMIADTSGNIWISLSGLNQIAKITAAGAVTSYTIPTPFSFPDQMEMGGDGSIWFLENGRVGRITPQGVITEYTNPSTEAMVPTSLSRGPNGNLWFVDYYGDRVGRISIVDTPNPSPPAGILNVPLLKQGIAPFSDNNPSWEGIQYDHGNSQELWCGNTIADCGCALTSIAMMLRYYGVVNTGDGGLTTPSTVNDYFNQRTQCGKGGCTSLGYAFGDVKWTAVNNYSADANKTFGTQKIIYDGGGGFNASTVAQNINDGKPVILGVPDHWVIATGISGNSFAINDPLFNRTLLDDPAYNNTAEQGIRKYKKTNSDFSAFEVAALAPSQIMVTDPEGRKTGFDVNTSSVAAEIPGSEYFFSKTLAKGTQQNFPAPEGSGVFWAIIPTPLTGEYRVEVVESGDQPSSIAVYGSDKDANTRFRLFEEENISNPVYSFNYNPLPNEVPIALDIPIDIRPNGSSNIINPKGNGQIQVAILSDKTFDPNTVKIESIKFGPNKASVEKKYHKKDVNKDGISDLILSFRTKDTGVKNGESEACLVGETIEGFNLMGCNKIHTAPKGLIDFLIELF